MPENTPTRLRTVRWDDRSALCRVTGEPFPEPESLRLWQTRKTSRIYHAGDAHLAKVCLVQSSPRNQLLRLAGRSRADIERIGSERLRALGLASPRITTTASVLNPFSVVDSLLVVEMVPDARDALHFLDDNGVSLETRAAFIDRVLGELELLLKNRLALRDFRLCNLLISGKSATPVWIDAELKPCRTVDAAKIRLRASVRRVLNKDCPAIPRPLAERLADGLGRLTGPQRPNE